MGWRWGVEREICDEKEKKRVDCSPEVSRFGRAGMNARSEE